MKIPIRHSFIGLILLTEACLLIKGEKCWMPMLCDGKPTWKNVTEGQCTKKEEKALEALTEKLDKVESELYQLKKTMEESETNSVPPFVVGVKEMTTLHGYKTKKLLRSVLQSFLIHPRGQLRKLFSLLCAHKLQNSNRVQDTKTRKLLRSVLQPSQLHPRGQLRKPFSLLCSHKLQTSNRVQNADLSIIRVVFELSFMT
ncbi:uncharacterized protein LOC120336195 isoform X2 [Styela clava]